jgi:hypothetical protein
MNVKADKSVDTVQDANEAEQCPGADVTAGWHTLHRNVTAFHILHVNIQYSFHQQTGPKFKEETSKVLHLERSFVWC